MIINWLNAGIWLASRKQRGFFDNTWLMQQMMERKSLEIDRVSLNL
jgi:hypothetical protein